MPALLFYLFVLVTGSCCLTQAGLEPLVILLPQHPKRWDHRHAPLHPVLPVPLLSAWQRRGFCGNLVPGALSIWCRLCCVGVGVGGGNSWLPALPSSLFPKREIGQRRGSPGAEHSRWGWSRSWGVGRSWQAAAPLRPGLGPPCRTGPHSQSPPAVPHLVLAPGLSDFSSCKTAS